MLAAREEQRVVLLLRFEVGDLRFGHVVLEWLKVVLVRLRVLNQVLFDRVIFILLAVVVAAEQGIEGQAVQAAILHAVSIAMIPTATYVIVSASLVPIVVVVGGVSTTVRRGDHITSSITCDPAKCRIVVAHLLGGILLRCLLGALTLDATRRVVIVAVDVRRILVHANGVLSVAAE